MMMTEDELAAIEKRNNQTKLFKLSACGDGELIYIIQRATPDIDILLVEVKRLRRVLYSLDALHICDKVDIKSLIGGITP